MEIEGKTRTYAIIGNPIEHSLSPPMHNAAFKKLGMKCVYLAFKIYSKDLVNAIEGIKALNIDGFNVTIPHKIRIIALLDRVDMLAKQIGSVNTVKNSNGKLVGYNTDGDGALTALTQAGANPYNKKIVLIGAGGAARAIGYTLAPVSERFTILNRTEIKAKELAKRISQKFSLHVEGKVLSDNILVKELLDADILINATSMGMYPRVNTTPVKSKFLRPNLTVFDAVYNPLETKLLRAAKQRGAKTISGINMLLHQGVKSFEIWFGTKPPIGVMSSALMNKLK
ncbi:MAG: shikimate dehydrogenase [Candidatus Bathyarchaeota archaeon]